VAMQAKYDKVKCSDDVEPRSEEEGVDVWEVGAFFLGGRGGMVGAGGGGGGSVSISSMIYLAINQTGTNNHRARISYIH